MHLYDFRFYTGPLAANVGGCGPCSSVLQLRVCKESAHNQLQPCGQRVNDHGSIS
jgi:hypothetical protein